MSSSRVKIKNRAISKKRAKFILKISTKVFEIPSPVAQFSSAPKAGMSTYKYKKRVSAQAD